MNSDEDNTTLLRMKRNFDDMLAGSRSSQRKKTMPRFRDDLDETTDLSHASSHVSMQQLLEREKEEQLRQMELVNARRTITQLENTIETLEAAAKKNTVLNEQKMNQLKLGHKHALDQVLKLEHQLSASKKTETELRGQLEEEAKTSSSSKHSLQNRLQKLVADNIKLSTDSQQVEQSLRTQIMGLKTDKLRLQSEVEICQTELEDTKEQLKSALKRCTDMSEMRQEAEEMKMTSQESHNTIRDLKLQLETMKDDCKVGLVFKDKLSRLQDLEAENRKLRDDNAFYRGTKENIVLLREEMESLRSKLSRSEARCRELTEQQLKHEETHQNFSVFGDSGNFSMKQSELSRQLADLQRSHDLLVERQGLLQTSTHAAEQAARESDSQLRATQKELQLKKDELTQLSSSADRLRRNLLIVTKERDNFHQLLMSSPTSTNKPVLTKMDAATREYQAQIKRLEEELRRVTERCRQAEHRLREGASQNVTQDSLTSFSSGADQKLILDLRQKIEEAEKRLVVSEERSASLETRLERHNLQGDYDPATTKVIHFRRNPATLAQEKYREEMAEIRRENGRLVERVRVLEEHGVEEGERQTPSTHSQQQQQQDLKSQMTSLELKNKRLMEVFKKTSQAFREVVYELLGYRIDITDISSGNQYKLMNMYAESPDDYFLFKKTTDGELQMLATDFSQSQEENIGHYLRTNNSIPALLSSVTMDLYSRQTMIQ